MRAIWKGAISFGLVTIPISLYPAIRREELRFHLLRRTDLSPVNYKRVAAADGKEVAWDDIVKGYQYEKDKYVVIKEDDFARVDVEATQTVDILSFVKIQEVNPLLFHKPYYMEPGKGGDRAYVLLREALEKAGKIAIAKVVIKTRQHLAAVKPQKHGLMLELMHFPEEILDVSKFEAPHARSVGKQEMNMAMQLIDSMTEKWKPEKYTDEYRDALEKMIEKKIEHGGKSLPKATSRTRKPSNVIDLVSILKKSIAETGGKKSTRSKPAKKRAAPRHRKKAA